jgi:hypothetical protein
MRMPADTIRSAQSRGTDGKAKSLSVMAAALAGACLIRTAANYPTALWSLCCLLLRDVSSAESSSPSPSLHTAMLTSCVRLLLHVVRRAKPFGPICEHSMGQLCSAMPIVPWVYPRASMLVCIYFCIEILACTSIHSFERAALCFWRPVSSTVRF